MNPQVSNKTAVIHHDLHLHYTLSGIGEITLLFVHGAFLDESIWNAQVDYFSSSYQVVTIDLAAHGKSGNNRSTWSIEQFGQDIIALIKRLQLKNVILIGHSMGGDAILEAAVRFPQAIIGFIAVDTFKNAGTPLPEEFQQEIQDIEEQLKADFPNSAEKFVRRGLLSPETPPAITARIVKAYREAYKPMGVELVRETTQYYERERELLQQLPFKLYLIQVNNTPTNTQALEQYAARSYELFEMKGTSHFPMLEHPREMNDLLGAAITQITKSKHSSEIIQFIEEEDS